MKNIKFTSLLILTGILITVSCDDFLTKAPLDTPSESIYWTTEEHAEMWVNNLYTYLGDFDDIAFEHYSDNAYGRSRNRNVANGTFQPNSEAVNIEWDYRPIRLALEFFENVDEIPDISQEKLDELSGQTRFLLAYQYYRLTTLYRDVPLVTEPLSIEESDVGKSEKEVVVEYILEQLNLAIGELPLTWPASEKGRITRGAALALKARVLLYNERWQEAAATAKQIIDSDVYGLHPNFGELYLEAFNNQTNEVILARQYADDVGEHNGRYWYAPVAVTCCARTLPTPELESSFEMIDGLPIDESPLYDPANPFDNRDPRYYETLLWHGQGLNGWVLDLTGTEFSFAITYLYYKKYLGDLLQGVRSQDYVNWIIFRYADVLLMYAEAKNEASGPDESIYQALDLIRERAGMPVVDRVRYSDQSSLREFIRNERRVELAGEGLRYFDIIRWRTAEDKLNREVTSMDLTEWENAPVDEQGNLLLPVRVAETRVFDPNKHYVWPIPQDAVDRSENLEQHPEWR